jgi:drug/metabolite transporter (DMT)-like permease
MSRPMCVKWFIALKSVSTTPAGPAPSSILNPCKGQPVPFFPLLLLGTFGTGVAFVSLATAAGRVGATRASSAAFLIPPVALLLGVLVRAEYVAMFSIIGSAVCVAGAWLMRGAHSNPGVTSKLPSRLRSSPMGANHERPSGVLPCGVLG